MVREQFDGEIRNVSIVDVDCNQAAKGSHCSSLPLDRRWFVVVAVFDSLAWKGRFVVAFADDHFDGRWSVVFRLREKVTKRVTVLKREARQRNVTQSTLSPLNVLHLHMPSATHMALERARGGYLPVSCADVGPLYVSTET
jgi:hypothetical protein